MISLPWPGWMVLSDNIKKKPNAKTLSRKARRERWFMNENMISGDIVGVEIEVYPVLGIGFVD